mgnify:CR=1 FL=1
MASKVVSKIKRDNEREARRDLMENLFYDFNVSRKQVYWINFWRGIFFGVGSIIGGTLIVALAIWTLNLLVDLPGGVGEFVEYIVSLVKREQ